MATSLGFAALPTTAATAAVLADENADAAALLRAAPESQSVEALNTVQSGASPLVAEQASYLADAYVAPAPEPVAAPAAAAPAVGLVVWPVPVGTRVSDAFGPRSAPCDGCSTFHDGLDLNPGAGTPVVAIADGVVVEAANDSGGLGTHVDIRHVVDGQTVLSSYGHMEYGSMTVSVGQTVSAGQLLGVVGTTGQSTGPHLHLELYHADGVRFDPAGWLATYAG
ncbi:M23 family metallopeptidase [Microterricola viridarii]|nr:M23 family metallopeptidase [Microterricola viridarii]